MKSAKPAFAAGELWTTEEKGILRRMVRQGFSDDEIAQRLDRTPKAIKVVRLQLAADAPAALDDDEIELLRKLYESGMSISGISRRLWRTEEVIRKMRDQLGLIRSTPSGTKQRRVVFESVEEALRYHPMQVGEKNGYERDAQLRAFVLAMRHAGHASGTGELIIGNDDRIPLRIAPALTRSPIGSSAAACIG